MTSIPDHAARLSPAADPPAARPARDLAPVVANAGSPPAPIPVPRGDGAGTPSSPQSSRERAVAGKPDPVTGAEGPAAWPAAPGRGRAQEPDRDALDGARRVPVRSSAHAAIAAAMTEDRGRDSLDAHVRRLCDDLDLLRYHTHDSRRSPRGFPDLVVCGLGGVLFRELKTQRGTVKPEQQAWLDTLAAAGADAGVWRPADLLSGRIGRELAALAGLKAGAA